MWWSIIVEKNRTFLLSNIGHKRSFSCISSNWQYILAVIVSPKFRKLWWIKLVTDHQTIIMIFFWWNFDFGKCCEASSWSSQWVDRRQLLQRIHFSSHVTIRSRKWIIFIAQKKSRWYFKTIFFMFFNLVAAPNQTSNLSSFSVFPIFLNDYKLLYALHSIQKQTFVVWGLASTRVFKSLLSISDS